MKTSYILEHQNFVKHHTFRNKGSINMHQVEQLNRHSDTQLLPLSKNSF